MGTELLIALAGGAIGAVLAGVGFVAVRLSAIPGDTARHDRLVAALDEDLERWVADDHMSLRHELTRIRNEMAAQGQQYSGALGSMLAEARTRALQRYRDQCSQAERKLADLIAEEGWPHERWRRIRRLERLELKAPARLEPVIEAWRTIGGIAPSAGRSVLHDPTRWTTADLLKDVRENPLEPAS